MSEKYKKTCKYLKYAENLLILSSTITACVSVSTFALLVFVASSAIGIKICAITASIKKYKSVIKKKKKKYHKIVLLGKDKLNYLSSNL